MIDGKMASKRIYSELLKNAEARRLYAETLKLETETDAAWPPMPVKLILLTTDFFTGKWIGETKASSAPPYSHQEGLDETGQGRSLDIL